MEKRNPKAPKQLSAFDFLAGEWECRVMIDRQDTEATQLTANWRGFYILDGYVIADEFRMMEASGNTVMLGMNYRCFNAQSNTWKMKWLEAISGTWLDLGPKHLGGVQISDSGISYKAEFKPGELHRMKFSDMDPDSFAWSVDISTDEGKSWEVEAMKIKANRVSD